MIDPMVGSAYQSNGKVWNLSNALPTLHKLMIDPMVGSAYQSNGKVWNLSDALPTLHYLLTADR
ncbi:MULTISPECIES: hypothetical protein [unclassified Moorena]|uniref:hypothetical protein n=1 Tax=unclassified Moorena TaxID=2683338 RepID=UPI0013B67CE0|nr:MULTISPECIES: hypothetical protein [unclassified Moorena]NEP32945.1 hypothetical protein [Moorena sp. SIO3B2]NEQ10426.1 hypothetical protein [Moorena sp. SIO4E2]NES81213.1 hypothetical protein [Moorena sp. SIO2B7]NET69037.1 hypothetical protein [Moorena sp. SIO1G6]